MNTWDYETCVKCGYENARCACLVESINPAVDPELVSHLVKQIQEALEALK